MLQALFKYQGIVCELYGIEVANASLYNLLTAIAESMLLFARVTGRKKFIISSSLPRERISAPKGLWRTSGVRIVEIRYDGGGRVDREVLLKEVDLETRQCT